MIPAGFVPVLASTVDVAKAIKRGAIPSASGYQLWMPPSLQRKVRKRGDAPARAPCGNCAKPDPAKPFGSPAMIQEELGGT
ncbi:MAG TPA: hypothetical protein VHM90_06780 [Phycisphaerae bacterium]|nr:hypothetical protein [Phycisphaerae bacterium]